MHPILFEAGPVTIYSYGVLLASAYLLGLWLGVRRARAAGLDGNRVMDLGIWVIVAALVGALVLGHQEPGRDQGGPDAGLEGIVPRVGHDLVRGFRPGLVQVVGGAVPAGFQAQDALGERPARAGPAPRGG